jgi:hypothetical protein
MPSQLILLAKAAGTPVRFADSPTGSDVDAGTAHYLKSAEPSSDVSATAIRAPASPTLRSTTRPPSSRRFALEVALATASTASYHKVSSRPSTAGWPRKRRSLPNSNPVREDLNFRPPASHARALSPDLQGQGWCWWRRRGRTAGSKPAPSTRPASLCRLSYVPVWLVWCSDRAPNLHSRWPRLYRLPPRRWGVAAWSGLNSCRLVGRARYF